MSTVTIRRNAFKKIASILANAKGVIAYSAHMQIDDSYDTSYGLATAEEALEWLKENQRGARVTMTGNELRIGGSYWFSREFVIYLDEEEFSAAKALYVKAEPQEVAAQPVEVVDDTAAEIEDLPVVLVAANDPDYAKPGANDDVYLIDEAPATPVIEAQVADEPLQAVPEKKAKPVKAIMLLEDGNYFLESRGNKMTLSRGANGWEMWVDNASHRAYRGAGVKVFGSLEAVEAKYKSWRGISTLLKESAYASN
ncbi:TPA: hypothetical protein ACYZE8_002387 [Salmonella enterica]